MNYRVHNVIKLIRKDVINILYFEKSLLFPIFYIIRRYYKIDFLQYKRYDKKEEKYRL